MRILHVTEDHSVRNTGVTRMVDLLSREVAAHLGVPGSVRVFAAGVESIPSGPGVRLFEFPLFGGGLGWRWSLALQRSLRQTIAGDTDIVHLHGVWMAPQWLAARVACRAGIPVILTAHGMLEPWMWKAQGRLKHVKKVIYWKALAVPVFRHISVVHATTPLEGGHLQQLLPGIRVEVIPNAVDVDAIDAESPSVVTEPARYVLFVGRLHPKKGVDVLLRAFAEAKLGDPWRLIVAGPAERHDYHQHLRDIVRAAGLEKQVEFIGSVDGSEKWRLMKQAWVVAVPSHSEAIGLVNLEAGACATPTVTTHATGLWDWHQGGGMLTNPRSRELAEVLRIVCSWSTSERRERGQASRRLVLSRYSVRSVADRWIELYKDLVDGSRRRCSPLGILGHR